MTSIRHDTIAVTFRLLTRESTLSLGRFVWLGSGHSASAVDTLISIRTHMGRKIVSAR